MQQFPFSGWVGPEEAIDHRRAAGATGGSAIGSKVTATLSGPS